MAWKYVQYNGETGKKRTVEGTSSSTLASLEDVSFSDLQDGQIPKYNSESQKWENADESSGTVTDVQVNGESVVNQQGVAEIPSIPDGLHHYSTTEHVIGTWIDGKPIYEKTVMGHFSSSSNQTTISHGVSNIKYVTKYEAFYIYQNQPRFIPQMYYDASGNAQHQFGAFIYDIDSSGIFITYGSSLKSWSQYDVYITIQYTKTTD